MKKILLALGLLAAVAVAAWAQTAGTNTVSRGGYYFNATTGDKTNASGAQHVEEQSPEMDANFELTGGQNKSLAGGAADSSVVLDTHRMRLGTLLINCYISSAAGVDTATTIRLIVQIRTHRGGVDDSLHTYALYQYGAVPGMNATTLVADTSVVGHIYKAQPLTGILATPSSNSPWSGEFVVLVSRSRVGVNSDVAIQGRTFTYPNAIAIPLSSLFGRDVYSPYTSIRIRNASSNTALVSYFLVGSPL